MVSKGVFSIRGMGLVVNHYISGIAVPVAVGQFKLARVDAIWCNDYPKHNGPSWDTFTAANLRRHSLSKMWFDVVWTNI